MAKLTHGTVLIEVSADELALIQRGLRVLNTTLHLKDPEGSEAARTLEDDLKRVW